MSVDDGSPKKPGAVQNELNRQALVQMGKRLSVMEEKLTDLENGLHVIWSATKHTDDLVGEIKLIMTQVMNALSKRSDNA